MHNFKELTLNMVTVFKGKFLISSTFALDFAFLSVTDHNVKRNVQKKIQNGEWENKLHLK